MKIFINYRRDESAGYAGRLFDHLAARFGGRNVFMDIDTIEPGQDFRKVVHDAVGTCDVVLVLIGKHWLNVPDDQGRRRLDDPKDWVRVEIATALANQRVRVIPVLVRDARMPDPEDLPEDVRDLAWRNAIQLSDHRFAFDANQLSKVIERTGGPSGRRVPVVGLWAAGLVFAILGLLLLSRFQFFSFAFLETATATAISTSTLADTPTSAPPTQASPSAAAPTNAFPLLVRQIGTRDLPGLPSLWLENGILVADMRSPGRNTYSGSVRVEQEYLFPLYWCATSTEILAKNLQNIRNSFFVNGEPVSDEYVLTYDHNPEGLFCKYAVIALSGWAAGQTYTLEAHRNILEQINDGRAGYPAGTYIRELSVSVR
jgi:hypothetical protein